MGRALGGEGWEADIPSLPQDVMTNTQKTFFLPTYSSRHGCLSLYLSLSVSHTGLPPLPL